MATSFSSRARPLLWQIPGRSLALLNIIIITALYIYIKEPYAAFIDHPEDFIRYLLFPIFLEFILWYTLCVIIPKRMPQLFNENTWSIGKDFTYNLICITVWMVLPDTLLQKTSTIQLTDLLKYKIPVSLVLSVALTGTFQMYFMTTNRKLANFVMQRLRQRSRLNPESMLVKIPEKREDGGFESKADELLFIHALNGKCELYCFIDGKNRSFIVNQELKDIRKLLGSITSFYRCHRSYIVNMDKVNSIEGDAAGLMISTEHSHQKIPVASNLHEEMKVRLLK